MNTTQSFETDLKKLQSMYQSIEIDIKKETVGRIEELIMENKFEQACAVIQHLRELVHIFDFEDKYMETQRAFFQYSENVFEKEASQAVFQAEQLTNITKTLQKKSEKLEIEEEIGAFQANVE